MTPLKKCGNVNLSLDIHNAKNRQNSLPALKLCSSIQRVVWSDKGLSVSVFVPCWYWIVCPFNNILLISKVCLSKKATWRALKFTFALTMLNVCFTKDTDVKQCSSLTMTQLHLRSPFHSFLLGTEESRRLWSFFSQLTSKLNHDSMKAGTPGITPTSLNQSLFMV